MQIKVERKWKKPNYCIGNLYIDGVWACNTAEDTDRNLSSNMPEEEIKKIKIKDHTAIPTGTYEIDMNRVSPRFSTSSFYKEFANGGRLPYIKNTKGFSGVLIHCGNYPDPDSSGCILVGLNKVKGGVLNSKETFKALYKKLSEAKDDITITIE